MFLGLCKIYHNEILFYKVCKCSEFTKIYPKFINFVSLAYNLKI